MIVSQIKNGHYQTYKTKYNSPNKKFQKDNKSDVSFGAIKITNVLKCLAIVSFLYNAGMITKYYINKPAIEAEEKAAEAELKALTAKNAHYSNASNVCDIVHPKLKQISDKIGWDKNTRILAAGGQNDTLYASNEDFYTTRVVKLLKQKNIKTLEQANDSLSTNGYVSAFEKFFSLETPGEKLNIFNKTKKNKNRFVLTFAQEGEELTPSFKRSTKKFSREFREIYGISKNNVINMGAFSEDDFKYGINQILKKIHKLKKSEQKNAELLIYYYGHGTSYPLKGGPKNVEGAKNGVILDFLDEQEVKKLFKKKLKNIKKIFMLQSCMSGGWIAQADKPNKTLRLLEHIA